MEENVTLYYPGNPKNRQIHVSDIEKPKRWRFQTFHMSENLADQPFLCQCQLCLFLHHRIVPQLSPESLCKTESPLTPRNLDDTLESLGMKLHWLEERLMK